MSKMKVHSTKKFDYNRLTEITNELGKSNSIEEWYSKLPMVEAIREILAGYQNALDNVSLVYEQKLSDFFENPTMIMQLKPSQAINDFANELFRNEDDGFSDESNFHLDTTQETNYDLKVYTYDCEQYKSSSRVSSLKNFSENGRFVIDIPLIVKELQCMYASEVEKGGRDAGLNVVKNYLKRCAEPKLAEIVEYWNSQMPEFSMTAFDAGVWNVNIPEKYGGLGMSLLDQIIVGEAVSFGCSGICLALSGAVLPLSSVDIFGTEEQKMKYMGMIASEPCTAALAVTEPVAGSNVAGITTKAVKEGDEYVINGTKMWITGAGPAKYFVTLARTAPDPKTPSSQAFTMFIVDGDAEGVIRGKKEQNMGQRASDTRMVTFDNVRVKKESILGTEGMGFKVAMATFDRTRPFVAGMGCGISWRALHESVKYSLERKTFGVPIAQHQAIMQMISEMTTSFELMRLMTYRAAHYIDIKDPTATYFASVVKYFAAEETNKNAFKAVQIFGGAGYNTEYPVEKLMRDARILPIYEGTTQIQQMIISREVYRNYMNTASVLVK
ncbi:unnamed protein product [Caenorhabditis bovis]|uniref:Acyl-CoA dehydrogenase n=1 Tax=Caenorhabditis bovis TaxID=2654633 RepID=A0A8S1FF09_9PELO|nr:unnamed protein product [Caenorhabditis bovis]